MNTSADLLTITEATTAFSGIITTGGNATVGGDLIVTGNDLTFGNGEKIDNTTDGTLAITATTTAISGHATVGSNFTVNGNTTLGNASSDTITMTGKLGSVTMNNGATIVNTNANLLTITEATTAFSGEITATGDITAYSSDKRLKTDIEVIESPLEKVKQLSGFTYNWNKENCTAAGFESNDEKQVGVFAQDVQKVIPEAVKLAPFDRDEYGASKSGDNYLTVQYEKIVPLLIESNKALLKRVEELEELVKNLNK